MIARPLDLCHCCPPVARSLAQPGISDLEPRGARDRWAEALRDYPAWRATITPPDHREHAAAVAMIAPYREHGPGGYDLQAYGRYMAARIRAGYDPEED